MLQRLAEKLHRRGIHQAEAFQCFIAGSISALCCLGTLLLLGRIAAPGIGPELIAAIAALLGMVSGVMAVAGYLSLLLLRLTASPENSNADNH